MTLLVPSHQDSVRFVYVAALSLPRQLARMVARNKVRFIAKAVRKIISHQIGAGQKYRQQFETLWAAGMQERIKHCNPNTQKEKIREFCRQLLAVDGNNTIALDALKKLDHKQNRQ